MRFYSYLSEYQCMFMSKTKSFLIRPDNICMANSKATRSFFKLNLLQIPKIKSIFEN